MDDIRCRFTVSAPNYAKATGATSRLATKLRSAPEIRDVTQVRQDSATMDDGCVINALIAGSAAVTPIALVIIAWLRSLEFEEIKIKIRSPKGREILFAIQRIDKSVAKRVCESVDE